MQLGITDEKGSNASCGTSVCCRGVLEDSVGALQASLPVNLGALLGHIHCPAQSCRRPLSRNDLCNLMHPAALKKVLILRTSCTANPKVTNLKHFCM